MAYSIFLKFLEGLEALRKNPRAKIPSKSPCAFFRSSAKIQKNQIKFEKILFLELSPAPDSGPAAARFFPFPIGPPPPSSHWASAFGRPSQPTPSSLTDKRAPPGLLPPQAGRAPPPRSPGRAAVPASPPPSFLLLGQARRPPGFPPRRIASPPHCPPPSFQCRNGRH